MLINRRILDKIYQLEDIIHYDIGKRGIEFLFKKSDLLHAVQILNSLDNVIIATGFYIYSAEASETDGPPGAIALANALKSIGKNVVLLTDRHNYRIIKEIISENVYSFDLICYKSELNLNNILNLNGLYADGKTGLVSIECPGRNIDSKYHNMSGCDISKYVASIDEIFIEAYNSDEVLTIGIGDGGNEIGMGNLAGLIKANVHFGCKICSEVKVNSLITAGVSNWGGIALAYALKLVRGNEKIKLMDSSCHEKLVTQMVNLGAVDGVTKKNDVSVDGISIDIHRKIIDKMYGIAND